MSKTFTKAEIISLLERSDRAVEQGVIRIYERQTADEQAVKATGERNGIGFNGVDAGIMSDFAETLLGIGSWTDRNGNEHIRREARPLSEKQIAIARRKIVRYAGQLATLANEKAAARGETPAPALEAERAGMTRPGIVDGANVSETDSQYWAREGGADAPDAEPYFAGLPEPAFPRDSIASEQDAADVIAIDAAISKLAATYRAWQAGGSWAGWLDAAARELGALMFAYFERKGFSEAARLEAIRVSWPIGDARMTHTAATVKEYAVTRTPAPTPAPLPGDVCTCHEGGCKMHGKGAPVALVTVNEGVAAGLEGGALFDAVFGPDPVAPVRTPPTIADLFTAGTGRQSRYRKATTPARTRTVGPGTVRTPRAH